MFPHERSEHRHPNRDQIGYGVIRFDELVDAVGQELERSLRHGVDEQPFLGPEEAVDGACGSADFIRDGSDGKSRDSAFGDQSLGRDAQFRTGLFVVFPRTTHLNMVSRRVTLPVT